MTTKMMSLVMVVALGACGAADRSPTASSRPAPAAAHTTQDQWITGDCSDKPVRARPVIHVEAPTSCVAGSQPF